MTKKVLLSVARTAVFCSVFCALSVLTAFAQETKPEDDKKFSFALSLNSDKFFGFYPVFQGTANVASGTDFTFYGILWSGGTGGAWGNWTEFGIGLNLEPAPGVSIMPQIGVLSGSLLSSTAQGPSIFAEGVVPNLTARLNLTSIEGEIYAGYYLPIADRAPANGSTRAYLHYWGNVGYKFGSFFSAGAHYEHLINSGGSAVTEAANLYQWIGPYVQFSVPNGSAFARFSFGPDLVDNNTFFKLTVGASF
jgi:hypothetical protein